MPSYRKDPDALLEYTVNWTNWLPSGDYIVSAAVTAITPSGGSGSMTVESYNHTTVLSTAFVSGGTTGQLYQLRHRIWTNGGRRTDRTQDIIIEER